MNHRVPDWHTESDPRSFSDPLPSSNCGKSTWPEDELVELLWQNGHVVMHRQTHGRTMIGLNETKQCQKPEPASKHGGSLNNSTNVVQEDAASWFQYPLDDSLENVFSDFCYGLRTTESADIDKLKDVVAEGEKYTEYRPPEQNSVVPESVSNRSIIPQFGENMTLPQSEVVSSFLRPTSADGGGDENFANFSISLKSDSAILNENLGEKSLGDQIQVEVRESSSVMTKGSSICGSNQIQNWFDATRRNAVTFASSKGGKEDIQPRFSRGSDHTDIHETTITSSSGGSGDASGRTGHQSASTRILKKKGVDADESEFQSEEAEYESMERNRQGQRSASCRRKRVAEVHNLSERRRRDRINEKMRALQELIPHCSKSDKASMLDEAIEYLKSLQLQLQLMWMGSGMAPMMFPAVHHYMSRMGMGMGMGHGFMPSIHGPIQFPRVPLANQHASLNPAVNQASLCSSPGINPINFQDQMQNPHISRSYGCHLGFHHMQVPPQMLNSYAYGAQLMQKNKAACAASSSPCDGGAPSENIQNGNAG